MIRRLTVAVAVATLQLPLSSEATAQGDRDALIALYNSTGGANWSQNDNWNSDADISTWHGVQVSDAGRVTRILMRDNNLTGSIPAELGNLSELTALDLRENNLTGPIPASLQRLANLETMFLRVNALNGPFPHWVTGMTNLLVLDVSDNAVTGSIPADIGSLSKLANFWVHVNPMSGEVPPSLGMITTLRTVGLGMTQLSGPLPRTLLQVPTCDQQDWCGDHGGLTYLTYENSGLCAPADNEFSAWLEGIFFTEGATCEEVPTPALPFVGTIALAGALAAAGRRRMRQLRARSEQGTDQIRVEIHAKGCAP